MVKIAMRNIKSQDIKDAVTLRNKIISDRKFWKNRAMPSLMNNLPRKVAAAFLFFLFFRKSDIMSVHLC
ncbi:MAG: hypothetical protein K2K67_01265 [Treponemataceae bacterium]|nr:hypothetical protein [Treponemataceae bacterium]